MCIVKYPTDRTNSQVGGGAPYRLTHAAVPGIHFSAYITTNRAANR